MLLVTAAFGNVNAVKEDVPRLKNITTIMNDEAANYDTITNEKNNSIAGHGLYGFYFIRGDISGPFENEYIISFHAIDVKVDGFSLLLFGGFIPYIEPFHEHWQNEDAEIEKYLGFKFQGLLTNNKIFGIVTVKAVSGYLS